MTPAMPPIPDHPLRYASVNELHARPFPLLEVPCMAAYVAIKEPIDAANRDRQADRAHLLALLDRHGAVHPQPDATHFAGDIGRSNLKWESHTEFVTYSAFTPGLSERPFDPAEAKVFPSDWLAGAPGKRLTSVLIRVEVMPEEEATMLARLDDWFVAESLAVARVVDALADPAVRKRLADIGQEVVPRDQQNPQALTALQKSEIEKWWPIIKAANIRGK